MNVIDFKGRNVPKNNAAFIKGEWYEINKDCIAYRGVYYRTTSKKVIKDYSQNVYRHINDAESMVEGLVDKDMKMGYFTPSNKNVTVNFLQSFAAVKKLSAVVDVPEPQLRDGNRVMGGIDNIIGTTVVKNGTKYIWVSKLALNEKVAKDNGFVEAYSSESYYKLSDCNSDTTRMLYTKGTPQSERVKDLYSIGDNKKEFDILKRAYSNLEIKSPLLDHKISAIVEPFSFGFEFEVTNGFLPKSFRETYGIKGLRDGSVANTGLEYVTVPYQGVKGLTTLRTVTNKLMERCENDASCSLHNHMGNVDRDKMFAVSLWSLGLKIQEEIFKMMPYERLKPKSSEKQVYCQYLPQIGLDTVGLSKCSDKELFDKKLVETFARIYMFLNDKPPGEIYATETRKVLQVVENEEIFKHIIVNKRYTVKDTVHSVRGAKWNKKARYYWLNLMPLYFSDYRTVEFRCHEATLNTTKTTAWLILTSCILHYAKNYKACLSESKVTLNDILTASIRSNSRLLTFMKEYVEHRKKAFEGKNADERYRKGDIWLAEDLKFKFTSSTGYTL